jgi:D-arabinose 1-dehydrogenase-like Zn-dependent alcohol dehydrogenase
MTSLPKTYKAAVFAEANAPLTIVERQLKLPSVGEVLVKVHAVGSSPLAAPDPANSPGVCHSDNIVQSGGMGNPFPIVPGHEIIGDVVAIGTGEPKWKVGDRVGGPWHGGYFLSPFLSIVSLTDFQR